MARQDTMQQACWCHRWNHRVTLQATIIIHTTTIVTPSRPHRRHMSIEPNAERTVNENIDTRKRYALKGSFADTLEPELTRMLYFSFFLFFLNTHRRRRESTSTTMNIHITMAGLTLNTGKGRRGKRYVNRLQHHRGMIVGEARSRTVCNFPTDFALVFPSTGAGGPGHRRRCGWCCLDCELLRIKKHALTSTPPPPSVCFPTPCFQPNATARV